MGIVSEGHVCEVGWEYLVCWKVLSVFEYEVDYEGQTRPP